MSEPRVETVVAGLLDRLQAAGGTAWVVQGQLRLRPLEAIPDDLIAALHANVKETIKQVSKRPKRLRDRVHSPEKRFMTRIRTELLREIRGEATKAQKLMIDRISWLSWHVNCFDRKALDAGGCPRMRRANIWPTATAWSAARGT
jgi:hypothetical protein